MSNTSLAKVAEAIGKTATFTTSEGLEMPVTVTDAKQAWGNLRFVIADAYGHTITVDSTRVQVTA